MRIALITLAVAALTFIGGILWIVANKAGINISPIDSPSSLRISDESAKIEILKSQWKNEERLKNIEEKLDAITRSPASLASTSVSDTGSLSSTGITST